MQGPKPSDRCREETPEKTQTQREDSRVSTGAKVRSARSPELDVVISGCPADPSGFSIRPLQP